MSDHQLRVVFTTMAHRFEQRKKAKELERKAKQIKQRGKKP